MKTFTCQCGCGRTQEINKYWRKPHPPKYIRGHNINAPKREEPVKKEVPPPTPVQTKFANHLNDDQLLYLRGHYGKMDRNKLAKRLNVSKWVLNFVVMELKLDKGA